MEYTLGTIFDLDAQRIATIKFYKTEKEFILLIPNEIVPSLPSEIFFIANNSNEKNNLPCMLSLSSQVSTEKPAPEGNQYIKGIQIFGTSSSNYRNDVRISLDMDVKVYSSDSTEEKDAKVKNISARGILLISHEIWKKGNLLSFNLPLSNENIPLVAEIVNIIPIGTKNLIGYGCQLSNLPEKTESIIRQFIFHEQLQHRKCIK